MSIIDRIRSLFSRTPTMGNPSPGVVMDRGEGEEAGRIDESRDAAHHHDLGAPNATIEESVRPPLS